MKIDLLRIFKVVEIQGLDNNNKYDLYKFFEIKKEGAFDW